MPCSGTAYHPCNSSYRSACTELVPGWSMAHCPGWYDSLTGSTSRLPDQLQSWKVKPEEEEEDLGWMDTGVPAPLGSKLLTWNRIRKMVESPLVSNFVERKVSHSLLFQNRLDLLLPGLICSNHPFPRNLGYWCWKNQCSGGTFLKCYHHQHHGNHGLE